MYSAAKEVDGTGTVDTTSNAAERLKLNQATSTTAGENSNLQVTVRKKGPLSLPLVIFILSSVISDCIYPILFLLSYNIITFIYLPFLPLLFHASSCLLKVGISVSSRCSFLVLLTLSLSLRCDVSRHISSRPVPSRPVPCPWPTPPALLFPTHPALTYIPCSTLPSTPQPHFFAFSSDLCIIWLCRSPTQRMLMKTVSTKLAAEQIYPRMTWTPH